jgi:hypothetical protein
MQDYSHVFLLLNETLFKNKEVGSFFVIFRQGDDLSIHDI